MIATQLLSYKRYGGKFNLHANYFNDFIEVHTI